MTEPCKGILVGLAVMLLAATGKAAEKITFEDHVLPIFRNNCLKCHNPNEQKGGLDLSNFAGALKGGGSGTSVTSGDPEGSKLFKAITHAEEPTMPPNARLPDKDIAVIRQWIAGGLLETSGSKAIASNKPKIDMAIDPAALKPKEPLPMPQDLLLQPVVHTERSSVATGLAANPWSPLVALGGQRQVLLYNTDSLDLVGILPFPEGYPHVLRFSRGGRLLLAGGGEGARQGVVVVWEVATGERVLAVGEEYDTVLAADISADQKWIALGGTDKLVKFYSTEDGQLKHSIKKHTDWVTAVEFSPDGKLLATGDRNGNLHVWEAATAQELYTLKGHRSWITALSWRADSQFLVSASEDGTAKLWQVKDEREARSTTVHNGGALFAHCALDGRVVTCGRDKQVSIWDANGGRQRNIAITNDLPVRAVFAHDGNRLITGDWLGNIRVWNAADGKELGSLSLNPPTLEQRLELANVELAKLAAETTAKEEALKAAQDEHAKFSALSEDSRKAYETARLNESGGKNEEAQWKEHQRHAEDTGKAVAAAKAALEKLAGQKTAVERRIAEIKAAQFNVQVHAARAELSKQERERTKAEAAVKQAEAAVEQAKLDVEAARKQLASMPDKIKGMENVIKFDRQFAKEPQNGLASVKRELAKAEIAAKKAAAQEARLRATAAAEGKDPGTAAASVRKTGEALNAKLAALAKEAAAMQAAVDEGARELEADQARLAKLREEEAALVKKLKELKDALRKAESQLAGAKAEVEKTARALAAQKERVEKLRAEYQQMRPSAGPQRAASL